MADTAARTPTPLTERTYQAMARAVAALRIFIGIDWLSNGLAKVFNVASVDWGFFSFGLINRDAARGIAADAAARTAIRPLGAFYQDVVLANWDVFGVLLTAGEVAIGLGLVFGVATRLAAVGGLLLIGPIWIMLWDTNLPLWDYPLDLVPLAVFAIVPAGRVFGLDRTLAARFRDRWPF